jgi:hypothetical protein
MPPVRTRQRARRLLEDARVTEDLDAELAARDDLDADEDALQASRRAQRRRDEAEHQRRRLRILLIGLCHQQAQTDLADLLAAMRPLLFFDPALRVTEETILDYSDDDLRHLTR